MTAAMGMSPLAATAAPEDCPVTDPPVINRCGPDPEPAPAPPPPAVRVALCQDGAFSFTEHTNYQGTCGKHGGVAQWLSGN
ncbi:MAG: hypothetical protein JWR13_282 [Mycobacterium sp.]|jgi:hypothetical protein|nr:hypothetical protein [Mycobacterium sp.]